jgi:hypothetical protein
MFFKHLIVATNVACMVAAEVAYDSKNYQYLLETKLMT